VLAARVAHIVEHHDLVWAVAQHRADAAVESLQRGARQQQSQGHALF
jgi:hypothetical protein